MEQSIEEGVYQSGNYTRENCKRLVKDIILAMQGSWMTRHCMTWQCTGSLSRGDAPAIVHKERKLDGQTDGMIKYMAQSETFSNKTMALFGLTSLSTEHLMVCRALTLATNIGCRVHGCIVDAVLVSGNSQSMQALAEAVGHKRRADGTELFQIKTVTKKAPNNKMAERVVVAERSAWRPAPSAGARADSRAKPSELGWSNHSSRTHERGPYSQSHMASDVAPS